MAEIQFNKLPRALWKIVTFPIRVIVEILDFGGKVFKWILLAIFIFFLVTGIYELNQPMGEVGGLGDVTGLEFYKAQVAFQDEHIDTGKLCYIARFGPITFLPFSALAWNLYKNPDSKMAKMTRDSTRIIPTDSNVRLVEKWESNIWAFWEIQRWFTFNVFTSQNNPNKCGGALAPEFQK